MSSNNESGITGGGPIGNPQLVVFYKMRRKVSLDRALGWIVMGWVAFGASVVFALVLQPWRATDFGGFRHETVAAVVVCSGILANAISIIGAGFLRLAADRDVMLAPGLTDEERNTIIKSAN